VLTSPSVLNGTAPTDLFRSAPWVLSLMIRFPIVSVLLFVSLMVYPASDQATDLDDVRYLVIRRAGSPEKNYYELAKQVFIFDPPPIFVPLLDVITKEPDTIRYGVHSIWKVRVLRVTDSQRASRSPKDGHYVLIYERDPDIRFCSIRYEVSSLPSGGRQIKYNDCEDKKQHSFEMTKQWPRPFVIYEIEVMDRNPGESGSHTNGTLLYSIQRQMSQRSSIAGEISFCCLAHGSLAFDRACRAAILRGGFW
jgi:hypothetical protein